MVAAGGKRFIPFPTIALAADRVELRPLSVSLVPCQVGTGVFGLAVK